MTNTQELNVEFELTQYELIVRDEDGEVVAVFTEKEIASWNPNKSMAVPHNGVYIDIPVEVIVAMQS